LTPDQQANFMAMQKLAQSQASQTAADTASNTQYSTSKKVEVNYQTSASQQDQSGSSTFSSDTYNAPPAQATQASQPINNNSSNQNIQPR
ncbi:MAG: hypothetical protein D8B37_03915, partial [Candidatus Saccharimonas sp.]